MQCDNPQNAGKVLRVGDVVITDRGEGPVTQITICPLPHTDPAGETSGVSVEAVELAEVPCVVTLGNGHWLYGPEVTARYLERVLP